MIKNVEQLVKEAMNEIKTISPKDVFKMMENDEAVLVDIRDVRELQREGTIPEAVHAPRGMLEFWVDPESPYHKPVFNQPEKTYVLFCAAAGRSALAVRDMQNMGFNNVAHIEGGFALWKKEELPIEKIKEENS